jgi:glycosyltransferase involved in cell wall biosynthesis
MITVAIPFYNTIDYLEPLLEELVDSFFVDEIVISNDASDYSVEIDHPKITIYHNAINQGAFRNKYLSVARSSNDWVYLLDSDNKLPKSSIDILENIQDLDPDTYYSPIQLNLVNDGLDESLDGKTVVYDFPERTIDLELAKEYLANDTGQIQWFLNTGNFLVNKKTYLETMKFIFDNPNHKHLEADAMAFTTHWLRKKKKIQIVSDLCYEHRVRPQSYSHAFGSRGSESLHYHRKLLLQS